MKITLRKANAIQNSIADTIKSIKISTSVEINEFESAEEKVQKANDTLYALDKRRSDLLMAQFAIRGLVGAANATSGIDAKLTQAAYIDKRISQLTDISEATERLTVSVLEGKLEKIRSRKEESRASIYGISDTVNTSVLEKKQIDEVSSFIKDLRKQKQKINDDVLELNVRTEIELDDSVVQVLVTENLI